MNGGTGTATTGTVSLAAGMPAARAVRMTPAGRSQWPGMRPWPLFAALGPLGALPTAPGLARAFTALVLGGWDLGRATGLDEVSELVVSELATNVVRLAVGSDGSPHYQADGRLTELWLRLMSDRALLRVEVWDNLPASAGVPALHRAQAEQEHGRGLAIIDQLSYRWGYDQVPDQPAKSVWALLKAQ